MENETDTSIGLFPHAAASQAIAGGAGATAVAAGYAAACAVLVLADRIRGSPGYRVANDPQLRAQSAEHVAGRHALAKKSEEFDVGLAGTGRVPGARERP